MATRSHAVPVATEPPARRKKASSSRPRTEVTREQGSERDYGEPVARVWGSTKIKINLGNYEGVEIEMGTSRTCDDTRSSIKRMHTQINRDHESLISVKIEEVRALWGALDDDSK